MQCRTRQPWNIRYPKSGTITAAQKAYVGRYAPIAAMLSAHLRAMSACIWQPFGRRGSMQMRKDC